jgi:hypothetical protein
VIVEFWGVGAATPTPLPFTVENVSTHLLADWLPTLPTSLSPALIGWPPFLIETVRISIGDCLALQERVAQSEKQWKGVVSWMLGVAGTRQFLESDGYRWVAPLSAFYPETTKRFVPAPWNIRFPGSSIRAERLQGSQSRLRPDYLAIRPLPSSEAEGAYELAVAESKGTHVSLASRNTCPPDWYNQARNVSLIVDQSPVPIPRHLVVATRVNPNAERSKTRRLQVRAWNKADESHELVPPETVPDIIAAQLFGFFLNLGLHETARAIALSVFTRESIRQNSGEAGPFSRRDDAIRASDAELRSKAAPASRKSPDIGAVISLDTGRGQIEVAVATPIVTLIQHLRQARSSGECHPAIRAANSELDKWVMERRGRADQGRSVLLSLGAEITFPENWA